jgi:hypothetical protein
MRRETDRSFPGKAGVVAWIAALVFALHIGIPTAQGKKSAGSGGRMKSEIPMQFPSHEEVPMSPRLDKPGIKVLLGASSFEANEPVALYGSYLFDGPFYVKCRGEASTWILLTAIARDIQGVWTLPVLTKPNLAPIAPTPPPLPEPSFRQYGFFNLDLRQHLQLPDQPSRYWLIVSMGDYKTEILSFELK